MPIIMILLFLLLLLQPHLLLIDVVIIIIIGMVVILTVLFPFPFGMCGRIAAPWWRTRAVNVLPTPIFVEIR
jgi:hypothetical protein